MCRRIRRISKYCFPCAVGPGPNNAEADYDEDEYSAYYNHHHRRARARETGRLETGGAMRDRQGNVIRANVYGSRSRSTSNRSTNQDWGTGTTGSTLGSTATTSVSTVTSNAVASHPAARNREQVNVVATTPSSPQKKSSSWRSWGSGATGAGSSASTSAGTPNANASPGLSSSTTSTPTTTPNQSPSIDRNGNIVTPLGYGVVIRGRPEEQSCPHCGTITRYAAGWSDKRPTQCTHCLKRWRWRTVE